MRRTKALTASRERPDRSMRGVDGQDPGSFAVARSVKDSVPGYSSHAPPAAYGTDPDSRLGTDSPKALQVLVFMPFYHAVSRANPA